MSNKSWIRNHWMTCFKGFIFKIFVKAVTIQEGPENFLAAPFFESFFLGASWKKDSKNGAARKF